MIRTFINHTKQEELDVEINTLPSLTQPDMTMTLVEMLERHMKGQEVPTFDGQDLGDDDYYPDPRELDLSERAEAYERAQSRVKMLQEEVQLLRRSQSGAKPAGHKSAVASAEGDKPQESAGQ